MEVVHWRLENDRPFEKVQGLEAMCIRAVASACRHTDKLDEGTETRMKFLLAASHRGSQTG